MARSRGWCFTANNYNDADIKSLQEFKCRYLIVGEETAPTTGRSHLQGYVYFEYATRFSSMQKRLPKGSHIEVARGTALANQGYCSKENAIIEIGEPPMQGRRTDLAIVRELVEDGANMRDIIATTSNLQGIKTGEKVLSYCERKRDFPPEVYWFFGPSGTGKTREASKMCPDAWWSGKNLKWWQGYDAHESVIIDDFRGDFCTFHELLRILDRYPLNVEVKGGSRQLLAKTIIITCPYRPESVYHVPGEQMCQLLRRITTLREFHEDLEASDFDTEVEG